MHDRCAAPAASARDEWRRNWPLVVAAVAGFSVSSLATHSMGLFLGPVGDAFGWSRAEVTSGLTIFAILTAPLAIVAGILIDRVGSRRLAIPGIILFSAIFASFGMTSGSLWSWWAQWTLFAMASPFVHIAIWTTAIARSFAAGRGLALGVTMCGTSITQIVAPSLANLLIEGVGWRGAYVGLGIGWGSIALALVLIFFRDGRAPAVPQAEAALTPARPGLTFRQALGSVVILRIAATELLVSLVNLSLIIHMVPILTSGGIAKANAAAIAGSIGLFAIVGKLATGWLLDRSQSGWIPSVSLWLPIATCLALLAPGDIGALLYVATAVFGYAVGAYFQIVTYLTTRYAGLANFGKIFAIMAGLMAIATGVGPLLAGMVFDAYGTYRPWLLVGAGLSLVAGFMVLRLGPYPDWERRD